MFVRTVVVELWEVSRYMAWDWILKESGWVGLDIELVCRTNIDIKD